MNQTNIEFRSPVMLAVLFAFTLGASGCGRDTNAENDDSLEITADEVTVNEQKEEVVVAQNDPPPVCNSCGTISNIEQRTEKGEGTGMGAVAGAVAGALIGREIVKGDRDKRNIAGAAGAVGGGYAGHQIEKSARSSTYYLVSVRMEDGRTETVTLNSTEGLSVGQKVRVESGNIILR